VVTTAFGTIRSWCERSVRLNDREFLEQVKGYEDPRRRFDPVQPPKGEVGSVGGVASPEEKDRAVHNRDEPEGARPRPQPRQWNIVENMHEQAHEHRNAGYRDSQTGNGPKSASEREEPPQQGSE